jgi:hypothetical protein
VPTRGTWVWSAGTTATGRVAVAGGVGIAAADGGRLVDAAGVNAGVSASTVCFGMVVVDGAAVGGGVVDGAATDGVVAKGALPVGTGAGEFVVGVFGAGA